MRLAAAELVESREILPGQWLQAYHAPDLANGSRAGQFVHVRTGDLSGMVLRRPFSINTADAATGIITIHFRVIGRGTDWFTRLRPGDDIDLLGPLGRPFEVDPRSQHLLLIAGGLGMAGVRMLADEAIRDGRQVTLLFGAAQLARGLPVEPAARRGRVRRRHGRRLARPPRLRHRARPRLRGLGRPGVRLRPDRHARRARPAGDRPPRPARASPSSGRKRGGGKADPVGSPAARRKAFLQVSMEQNMGCAVGACLGCVVMSTTGVPQRVCREGPVFAAEELVWEGAWT